LTTILLETLDEITPEAVDRFKLDLVQLRTKVTVNRYLALLRHLFNRRIEDFGHSGRNPRAGWACSFRQGGRPRCLIRRRSRPPPRVCPPSACWAGGAGSGPHLAALQSSLPGRSAARYTPAIVTRCGHWADTEPAGRGAGDKKHASGRLRTIASSILTSQHTASESAHHQFHRRLALEVRRCD
jgi:hypothetical protein